MEVYRKGSRRAAAKDLEGMNEAENCIYLFYFPRATSPLSSVHSLTFLLSFFWFPCAASAVSWNQVEDVQHFMTGLSGQHSENFSRPSTQPAVIAAALLLTSPLFAQGVLIVSQGK